MGRKKKKVVKTTILLPPEVHQALRIEAITKKMSMGELIVQKLKGVGRIQRKIRWSCKGRRLSHLGRLHPIQLPSWTRVPEEPSNSLSLKE
jgi:hypothetical protein